MQKLVTICLSTYKLENAKTVHGTVEEHLGDYMSQGYRITSVSSAGSGHGPVWVAVVMEKDLA